MEKFIISIEIFPHTAVMRTGVIKRKVRLERAKERSLEEVFLRRQIQGLVWEDDCLWVASEASADLPPSRRRRANSEIYVNLPESARDNSNLSFSSAGRWMIPTLYFLLGNVEVPAAGGAEGGHVDALRSITSRLLSHHLTFYTHTHTHGTYSWSRGLLCHILARR